MDFARAVNDRLVIRFTYDGLARLVQPATFGLTAKGKHAMRGCQIGGGSERNPIPCWELYLTEKMVGPGVTGESFTAFESVCYRKGDRGFNVIIAEHRVLLRALISDLDEGHGNA